MPKIFKTVIAALAIIILAVATYNYLSFADERKVRRALLDLQDKVSEPMTGGMSAVLTASSLKPFFTPKINISFQHGGSEQRHVFEQDELLRIIIGIKQHNPDLTVKLDFSRRNIQIADGRIATVSVMVTVENLSETFDPQRLTFTFEKNEEARWRLSTISEGAQSRYETL